jgi:hypothetical protein
VNAPLARQSTEYKQKVRLDSNSWSVIRNLWCVHNRLFNASFEEIFKWTPIHSLRLLALIFDGNLARLSGTSVYYLTHETKVPIKSRSESFCAKSRYWDRDEIKIATGRTIKRLSTLNDMYYFIFKRMKKKIGHELTYLFFFSCSYFKITIFKFAVFKF